MTLHDSYDIANRRECTVYSTVYACLNKHMSMVLRNGLVLSVNKPVLEPVLTVGEKIGKTPTIFCFQEAIGICPAGTFMVLLDWYSSNSYQSHVRVYVNERTLLKFCFLMGSCLIKLHNQLLLSFESANVSIFHLILRKLEKQTASVY